LRLNFKTKVRNLLRFYKTQMIVFIFMFLVLAGGVLLTLPIASRSGESIGFLNALFTATSATCVTGLVVVDTYQHWTLFGQLIIITLIQVGGLGFMTMATLFSLLLRRAISLNERLLIRESLNYENMQGIVRLTKHILVGTFFIELLGAILLSFRFIPEFGVKSGIMKSIFHSVSAFCNAGFDIMGNKGAFSGLTTYVEDPLVNIVIMSLIVIGGIGFAVWEDIWTTHKIKKLSLHSKIVLSITSALILSGALFFFVMEYNNPQTMQPLSFGGKVLASFFQSITPRTAGYNTINLAGLTDSSKFITMILMFIGGSPGSTAGGIKVVTFCVLVFAAFSVVKGTSQVVIFHKRISVNAVLRSMTITMIGIFVVAFGTLILSTSESATFMEVLFETVSAFGTVGLTLGITPMLSAVSKVCLIFIMFFGRVGVLAVALIFVKGMNTGSPDKIKYPEEKIMVG